MKYFLGFLAVVGLIVVAFILILHSFSHTTPTPKNQITLTDFANSQTVVQLNVIGPVVANQNHTAYQIIIGRDGNNIQVTSGYQGSVVAQQSYPNNPAAYADFLRALQLDNFTRGISDSAKADDRGACAAGQRYEYSIVSDGQTVQRFWGSSCGGGTFQGAGPAVRELFARQIPDLQKIIAPYNF